MKKLIIKWAIKQIRWMAHCSSCYHKLPLFGIEGINIDNDNEEFLIRIKKYH